MISSANAWLPAIVFSIWVWRVLIKSFPSQDLWCAKSLGTTAHTSFEKWQWRKRWWMDSGLFSQKRTFARPLPSFSLNCVPKRAFASPCHPSLWSVSHVCTKLLRASHVNYLTLEGAWIFQSFSTTMLDCRIVCCDKYPNLTVSFIVYGPWVGLAPHKRWSFSILRLTLTLDNLTKKFCQWFPSIPWKPISEEVNQGWSRAGWASGAAAWLRVKISLFLRAPRSWGDIL